MSGKSTAVGSKITAAKKLRKKAVFCLGNITNSCSVRDINSFVSSLSVELLSCFEVKPRRRRGEDAMTSSSSAADRKAFRL